MQVLSNELDAGAGEILRHPVIPRSELEATSTIKILEGSFPFSTSSTSRNVRSYHPAAHIQRLLWQYYVDNVDVLVKILHKPTLQALIASCQDDTIKLNTPTEALLFAIYFASVTTMSAEECLRVHGEERGVLIQRYRIALERSLAQARLLTSQEIVVLQAMILLIVSTSLSTPVFLNDLLIILGLFSSQGSAVNVDAEWHSHTNCSSHGNA